MIKRYDLISTVTVQAASVLATMAISIVVARRLGAEGQGFWANYRAMVDLVAVVAAYGFPASFVYLVNVRKISIRVLTKFVYLYTMITLPVIGVILFISYKLDFLHLETTETYFSILMITLGSVAMVGYSMVRGLCLPCVTTNIFNVISAILPLCLLITLMLWPLNEPSELMLAGTAGIIFSLIFSVMVWIKVRFKTVSDTSSRPISWKELMGQGGWNFMVASFTVALPAYTLQRLSSKGIEIELIGCFSVAALVMGALLTPANLVGPIIYNFWAKTVDKNEVVSSYGIIIKWILIISLLICGFAWMILPVIIPLLVGQGFEPAIGVAKILLLAVPLGYGSRLMSNVLMANGFVDSYAISSIIKLGICILMIEVTPILSIQQASVAWVIAELSALVACAYALKLRMGWTMLQLSGMSFRGFR